MWAQIFKVLNYIYNQKKCGNQNNKNKSSEKFIEKIIAKKYESTSRLLKKNFETF